MNRHQRRAAASKAVKPPCDRAAAIDLAMLALAAAAPTATGATIVHPDGTTTYISAADARAWCSTGTPERRA